LRDHDRKHLKATHMPFLRTVYEVTMKNKIRDKDICIQFGEGNINEEIQDY
jgi:hypothetical protein